MRLHLILSVEDLYFIISIVISEVTRNRLENILRKHQDLSSSDKEAEKIALKDDQTEFTKPKTSF